MASGLNRGFFGLDILHQDKEWLTKDGRRLRLEDMTWEHRYNLIKYLRRRAGPLALRDAIAALKSPLGPIGRDASEAMMLALYWQVDNPKEWLEELPLIKRLKKLNK